MDALDAIARRRSIGRLQPPAPSADDLTAILKAAASAPDHGELRPFRFTVLDGDAQDAFGRWVDHITSGTRADDNVARAVELTRLVVAANAAARVPATV